MIRKHYFLVSNVYPMAESADVRFPHGSFYTGRHRHRAVPRPRGSPAPPSFPAIVPLKSNTSITE